MLRTMFGKHKPRTPKRAPTWTPMETSNDRALEEAYPAGERARVMESVPLLARLHPADRRNLGAVGVMRSYPAGAELVKEGQRPGVGLFIILRGRVRISQRVEAGTNDERESWPDLVQRVDWDQVLARVIDPDLPWEHERYLGTLGPGEMFGEMALLDEQPRSATVTAFEPTLAFVIPIVDFRVALAHNPEAAYWLLQVLSRRVRQAERSG